MANRPGPLTICGVVAAYAVARIVSCNGRASITPVYHTCVAPSPRMARSTLGGDVVELAASVLHYRPPAHMPCWHLRTAWVASGILSVWVPLLIEKSVMGYLVSASGLSESQRTPSMAFFADS